MPENFEENPSNETEEGLETNEGKNPENTVEYFKKDLEKQKEELKLLEAKETAMKDFKDFIEIKNPTKEDMIKFLQEKMDEFEKEIELKKSAIEKEEKELEEKKAELENKR